MILIDTLLRYIQGIIAGIGVMVICLGTLRSLYQFYHLVVHKKLTAQYIHKQFGLSVILALEFLVAADIVGSLIEPNYYTIGLLAIMVIIRTILSFFLSRELHEN